MKRQLLPLLALFVALGGTSYAAVRFPPNSIGTKQLKRNAVTQPKIKANAVNAAKIVDDSVTGADVLESSLGKVPRAFHVDSVPNAANAAQATNTSRARRAASTPHATDAGQLGGVSASDYAHTPGACGPGRGYNGSSLFCTSAVIPFAKNLGSGESETDLVASRGYFKDVDVSLYCNLAAPPTTYIRVVVDNPGTLSYFYNSGTTTFVGSDTLGTNTSKAYGFDDKRIEGQYIWSGPGGEVATIKVDAVEVAGTCQLHGTAIFAGY